MSLELAVGVYLIVHIASWYLLRVSGTWRVLFASTLDLAPDRTPDPLRAAPRGWIENHSFWDLGADEADDETEPKPDEHVFWGDRHHLVG